MKKILILARTLSITEGQGRYSVELLKRLVNNFEITVITTEKASINENDLLNLKIYELSKEKKEFKYLKFYNLVKNIVFVRKMSKESDVVHAFDGWPYGVLGYFSVIGTKKKFFINGIGTYSVAPLFDQFKGFLLRKAYRKAQKIFCISSYVKKRILEKIKLNNIEVVHLGPTKLPDLSQNEISFYREKYNIKDLYYPVLLTVGGIKERKGQLDTLKSTLCLKEKYSNYLYLIVGSSEDSSYINKIKKFIKDNELENNVKIISNAKTDKELSFFYNICDVFLLNSNNDGYHFEGFGLVFLEAAQFGKPLIGSSGCGIEDAIENGYNGFLVEQKDTKEIYKAVIKVLENKEINFNKNSKKFYKKFSWESTALEYSRDY